jgi:dipicolinate synthase subunit A
MLERAPAIVEGAIAEIVRHTKVTIDDSEIAVVGYGNIGSLLARRLAALGGRVHVAARRAEVRADAQGAGLEALTIEGLPELAPRVAMVCSTVPAPVVGRDVLERLPHGALAMDLAAPPGGVDLDLARSLGIETVWARGLGRRAPITVGRSQWGGIRERIERFEAAPPRG